MRYLLPAIMLLTLITACQPYRFKGTEYLDPVSAPDFELTRGDGGGLRLSSLRGQTVLLFFGFTACPDVCPTTLADARRILEGLGEKSSQVQYLFITVDPERDTPEALQKYVSVFDPAIVGLTGSPEALARVWEDYGILVDKTQLDDSTQGYTVTHTARVFVIDDQGQLRLSYPFGTPYEDLLSDLRHLLEQ